MIEKLEKFEYSNVIFDCDGVILNSNKIKSDAFYQTVLNFGFKKSDANTLLDYHKKNLGISRYEKFAWFLGDFLKESKMTLKDQMIKVYSQIVFAKLIKCEIFHNLDLLYSLMRPSKWFVVSGSDKNELNEIFKLRGISNYFKQIYGSPKNKFQIISECLNSNMIDSNTIFFGDSDYDYKVSNYFGFDFIFLTEWTDLDNYEEYCNNNSITYFDNLSNIVDIIEK